jgi:hypothetical protein
MHHHTRINQSPHRQIPPLDLPKIEYIAAVSTKEDFARQRCRFRSRRRNPAAEAEGEGVVLESESPGFVVDVESYGDGGNGGAAPVGFWGAGCERGGGGEVA